MFSAYLEPPVSPLLVVAVEELHQLPKADTDESVEVPAAGGVAEEQDRNKRQRAESQLRVSA